MERPAISVRQPWAWAIVAGHKPVENRVAAVAGRFKRLVGSRIAIHASRSFNKSDWADAERFMSAVGVGKLPKLEQFEFGGVIGSAIVRGVVAESDSPWFFGPSAIELSDARRCTLVLCRGQVGLIDLGREIAELAFGNPLARG
jgi:hypothetical protein